MKRFSIEYYEGEELKKELVKDFHSVQLAGQWCNNYSIPRSIIRITEWDIENNDSCGIPEIIGSCNLDEAFELEYTSLDF